MILRVEDHSWWREVVGGCNPCRRLAGKWLEITTKGLGCAVLVRPWGREKEERRRETKCLDFTKQKLKQNKYLAEN